jgi:hypothetical protein
LLLSSSYWRELVLLQSSCRWTLLLLPGPPLWKPSLLRDWSLGRLVLLLLLRYPGEW